MLNRARVQPESTTYSPSTDSHFTRLDIDAFMEPAKRRQQIRRRLCTVGAAALLIGGRLPDDSGAAYALALGFALVICALAWAMGRSVRWATWLSGLLGAGFGLFALDQSSAALALARTSSTDGPSWVVAALVASLALALCVVSFRTTAYFRRIARLDDRAAVAGRFWSEHVATREHLAWRKLGERMRFRASRNRGRVYCWRVLAYGLAMLTVLFALVAPVLALLSGGGTVACIRRAKRLASVSATDLIESDPRPPVMLFRSFADESLLAAEKEQAADEDWSMRVQSTIGRGRWLIFGLLTKLFLSYFDRLVRRPFETLLVDELSVCGPVVAIGMPGSLTTPAVGAARDLIADDHWRAHARALAERSQTILFVVGQTTGLTWEAAMLAEAQLMDRVLLIMPPLNKSLRRRRWREFLQTLSETSCFAALHDAVAEDPVVIALPKGEPPVFISSSKRSPLAYEVALRVAEAELSMANRRSHASIES